MILKEFAVGCLSGWCFEAVHFFLFHDTVSEVMTSDSFMAALMDPGNKRQPSKQLKKKVAPASAKSAVSTTVIPSVMASPLIFALYRKSFVV